MYCAIYWLYIQTIELESQKAYGNKTKFNIEQETHYISVCTKFEELILIHEGMNAEQDNSYALLELIWQGKNIKSPWATSVKWAWVTGDGYR